MSVLPELIDVGVAEFSALVRAGRIDPGTEHILCHYSAEHFRAKLFARLCEAGYPPDDRRWFTNLHTAGNTGAASIFVMLAEARPRLRPGDRVLLIVPETGRFSFAFAHLTCVGLAPAAQHRRHHHRHRPRRPGPAQPQPTQPGRLTNGQNRTEPSPVVAMALGVKSGRSVTRAHHQTRASRADGAHHQRCPASPRSPGGPSPLRRGRRQAAPGGRRSAGAVVGPQGRRRGAIMGRMIAWRDVEQAEPEFARRVRALFDAHRHKTIATLRADGSPRISGIEAVFENGQLGFGSMPGARKGADLRRDPRFAMHSATVDPVEGAEAQWPGEAKISGRAIGAGPVTDGTDGDSFSADIAEVVHTHLNEQATMLVVEWWTPTHGLRRIERE
jgi:hypothetical protein